MSKRPTHAVVSPHGITASQHLTRERAEAAAARRGEGYTVREIRRAPGRRPSRGSSSTVRLEVRVTPEEAERYRAAAEREGVDLGPKVRELLDAWAGEP